MSFSLCHRRPIESGEHHSTFCFGPLESDLSTFDDGAVTMLDGFCGVLCVLELEKSEQVLVLVALDLDMNTSKHIKYLLAGELQLLFTDVVAEAANALASCRYCIVRTYLATKTNPSGLKRP